MQCDGLAIYGGLKSKNRRKSEFRDLMLKFLFRFMSKLFRFALFQADPSTEHRVILAERAIFVSIKSHWFEPLFASIYCVWHVARIFLLFFSESNNSLS